MLVSLTLFVTSLLVHFIISFILISSSCVHRWWGLKLWQKKCKSEREWKLSVNRISIEKRERLDFFYACVATGGKKRSDQSKFFTFMSPSHILPGDEIFLLLLQLPQLELLTLLTSFPPFFNKFHFYGLIAHCMALISQIKREDLLKWAVVNFTSSRESCRVCRD